MAAAAVGGIRTGGRMARGKRWGKMSRRERSSPAARRGGQGGSGSTTAAGIVEDGAARCGQTAGKESSISSEAGPPSKRATAEELEGVTAEMAARSVWLGDGRSDGSVRRQWRRPDRELGRV